jgi:hypothetical protein
VGSNVLGIGLIAFIGIDWSNRTSWQYLAIAAVIMVATLFNGQITARFVFESFALSAIALAVCNWNRRKAMFQYALLAQALLVSVIAIYTAALLFPGNFGAGHRDAVMRKVAHNYAVSRWLESIVPEDALLLSRIRSNVLLPRRSRSSDEVRYLNKDEYRTLVDKLANEEGPIIFVEYDLMYSGYSVLDHCNSKILDGPGWFNYAARNPVTRNSVPRFSLVVLEYLKGKRSCTP